MMHVLLLIQEKQPKKTLKKSSIKLCKGGEFMNNDERLQKIMGLGKESSKKTYYPDFKNNLKQLSQEKEKLEAMFNNAINGIIRIELDGKIIASNKSSTKLLQEIFPNFSINNTNALDIFGKELWEEVKEKTLKTRKIDMIEFVVPSKVKNYWLQLNMIYQSPLGIEPYFEAFFQDVTIKKEYELQLTNMNKLLEKKVDERTKDLEDFAYIISHDLKAPLRAINQLSNWILEDYEKTLDDEGKNILHLMEDRISTMESLINGVLEYSRIGRNQEASSYVYFEKLLNEITKTFSIEKNIVFEINNNISILKGNKTKFVQVYQNLISNAIKYMDKPKGIITLTTHTNPTNYILIVKDNGSGIEEKFLPHIFEIFNTAGRETTKRSTGIGLSIVKKIIDSFDGSIQVNSVVKEGTEFIITIPKREEYL